VIGLAVAWRLRSGHAVINRRRRRNPAGGASKAAAGECWPRSPETHYGEETLTAFNSSRRGAGPTSPPRSRRGRGLRWLTRTEGRCRAFASDDLRALTELRILPRSASACPGSGSGAVCRRPNRSAPRIRGGNPRLRERPPSTKRGGVDRRLLVAAERTAASSARSRAALRERPARRAVAHPHVRRESPGLRDRALPPAACRRLCPGYPPEVRPPVRP